MIMNIIKIEKGFIIEGSSVSILFKENAEVEINSETMCHIPTENGIFCFDTSVAIDGKSFETIEEWIAELYK